MDHLEDNDMGDSTSYYKSVRTGLFVRGNEVIVNQEALKKRSYFHYIVKEHSVYDINILCFTNIIRTRLDVYISLGYSVVFQHEDKKVLIIYNKLQP